MSALWMEGQTLSCIAAVVATAWENRRQREQIRRRRFWWLFQWQLCIQWPLGRPLSAVYSYYECTAMRGIHGSHLPRRRADPSVALSGWRVVGVLRMHVSPSSCG